MSSRLKIANKYSAPVFSARTIDSRVKKQIVYDDMGTVDGDSNSYSSRWGPRRMIDKDSDWTIQQIEDYEIRPARAIPALDRSSNPQLRDGEL